MKLTLREARRLEKRIEREIILGVNFTATRSIFEDHEFVGEWLKLSCEKTVSDQWKQLSLAVVRNQIRREIQKTNETSGINQAISERHVALYQLDRWSAVVEAKHSNENSILDAEALQRKIIKLREKESSYRDNVTACTISQEFFEEAKNQVQLYQTLVDGIDDLLLSLNSGTKISLTEMHEEILREHKLIA